MIRSTPSFFIANILARKLTSVGSQRWPLPWRGKKISSASPSRPRISLSDGLPKGVVTATSRTRPIPSIRYRPLPPMTPMIGAAMDGLERFDGDSGAAPLPPRLLALKLTTSCLNVIAARPALVDLYAGVAQDVLKALDLLWCGSRKSSPGMQIEGNHVDFAGNPVEQLGELARMLFGIVDAAEQDIFERDAVA